MATLVAAPMAGALAAMGPVGWVAGVVLMAGAGVIDSRMILPGLLGSDKRESRGRKLFDLTEMTLSPGSPSVWALGRRVRVPVHVFWQSEKIREEQTGGGKGGTGGTVRKVFVDAGLLLNDRRTNELTQLIGNGKLIYYKSRNLVQLRSGRMTVAAVNSDTEVRLTMASSYEPDFTDYFIVHDRVHLAGFVTASGTPSLNQAGSNANGPRNVWRVTGLTSHAPSTPSTLTVRPFADQTVAGMNSTAGTLIDPATVTRIDDMWCGELDHRKIEATILPGQPPVEIQTNRFISDDDERRMNQIFQRDDKFNSFANSPFTGQTNARFVATNNNIGFAYVGLSQIAVTRGSQLNVTSRAGSATNGVQIHFANASTFTAGTFASDPADNYHEGTESQGADDIIAAKEDPSSSGTVPGFRGMAYQVFDDFDLSLFGNQLPLCEAIIQPDTGMLWGDAVSAICQRSGLTAAQVDVSAIEPRPFEGYYLRGTTTGNMALQPLLMAGQILHQERSGQIRFFDLDNADSVQIQNGSSYTDLGAYVGADTPNQSDKILYGQGDPEDLPTSVTVKHQDPDNVYAQAAEQFALRAPVGVDFENSEVIDLGSLVLTRRQAKNFAATALRRAWVNSQTVEVSLPAAYLDLAENDLITVTDDEGNDVQARIVRRDIGTNYLVDVAAVREELNLAVSGSPIQSAAGTVPPPTPTPPTLDVHVLDVPAVNDGTTDVPGVWIQASAQSADGAAAWVGAGVWESVDGGTSYNFIDFIAFETPTGYTTTTLAASSTLGENLGSSPGPNWDTSSTVDVRFESSGGGFLFGFPATVAQASVEGTSNLNWFLIGDEIVGVQNVDLQSNGDYRLSTMLRGLRGTYNETGTAQLDNTRVVALYGHEATGLFCPRGGTAAATRHYKVVPAGQTLADVDAVTLTVQGYNARPLPVRGLSVLKSDQNSSPASGAARFNLAHWSRAALPVGSQGPYPLDETFEEYVLRIYDPGNSTLKRTYTKTARGTGSRALRDAFIDYPAADQITDGYTPSGSETYWIEVAQKGDHGEGRTWRQEV